MYAFLYWNFFPGSTNRTNLFHPLFSHFQIRFCQWPSSVTGTFLWSLWLILLNQPAARLPPFEWILRREHLTDIYSFVLLKTCWSCISGRGMKVWTMWKSVDRKWEWPSRSKILAAVAGKNGLVFVHAGGWVAYKSSQRLKKMNCLLYSPV